MLDSLIEVVKFVGGLGGLASSAFLVYDRLLRDRPAAFLVPADFHVHLLLRNTASETIVIDEITITPPILVLHRPNDLMTAQQAKAAVWYPSKNDADAMRT